MKILIAGSDLNAFLLAKYIKAQSKEHDIYITTEEADCEQSGIPDGYNPVGDGEANTPEANDESYYIPTGIKDNDIAAICDFVKYNQIELTIVTSQLAIINGIADEFEKEGFPIAAPFSEAARVTFFNSIAKKVMYKLKINTPRFGIFDRENIASEYIRRTKFPIAIMNDFTMTQINYNVYTSYPKAKAALLRIFENAAEKIVIENYIESPPIYLYFLTDGYNAVPLISIEKNEEKSFTEIKAPSKKITEELTKNIMQKALFPLIDDIAKYAGNYSGIIGMKLKIQGNNFYVLEYYNNFQDYDLQVFLSLLNEDIVELLHYAAEKQLKDVSNIELEPKVSYTIAVNKKEMVKDADDEDYFITEDEKNVVITKTAATMNFAKEDLTDYLSALCNEKTFKEIVKSSEEVQRI